MRVVKVVRRSRTYRSVETVRGWAAGSTLVALLRRERVLYAAVGGLVAASVVAVLGSNLGSALKFLSFLATFAVVAAMVVSVADPPSE